MAFKEFMGLLDDVRKTVEKEVREEILRRNLTAEDLAKLLGIFTSGAIVLLRRDEWNIETALRVASSLDLDVKVEVLRKDGN